jgi:hypothetical protein
MHKQIFHHVVLKLTFSAKVPWWYSCSRSIKVFFESISYSIAPFEDRLNDLQLAFVLAWREPRIRKVSWRTERSWGFPSRSMMMLCNKQIHLTILSALLTFVSIALFNNRHFTVRIPKPHSMHLLARDAATSNTVVHLCFLIWSLSRLLCCVGSGSNVATALIGSVRAVGADVFMNKLNQNLWMCVFLSVVVSGQLYYIVNKHNHQKQFLQLASQSLGPHLPHGYSLRKREACAAQLISVIGRDLVPSQASWRTATTCIKDSMCSLSVHYITHKKH